VIQQKVEDQLSDTLLSGEFQGCAVIEVDVEDDEIVLRRSKEPIQPPNEEPEIVATV